MRENTKKTVRDQMIQTFLWRPIRDIQDTKGYRNKCYIYNVMSTVEMRTVFKLVVVIDSQIFVTQSHLCSILASFG